jgi:hypothetical protein
VEALATLGTTPTPRLPANIDAATTSFTIFLFMGTPSKSDRLLRLATTTVAKDSKLQRY